MQARYIDNHEPSSIFAALRIEPALFAKAVEKHLHGNQATPEEKIQCGLALFPHFRAMDTLASKRKDAVTRVLLAEDGEWIERNREHFDFFEGLNGKHVPCFVLMADQVPPPCKFLTDHAIFSKKLCFDYYGESQTLIVTESNALDETHPCIELMNYYVRSQASRHIVIPLADFIQRHNGAKH